MPWRRGALGAIAAVWLLVAPAAVADESVSIAPTAAAWYPTGVGAIAAPTYPEGTLHVGAIVGQETDRTYLRFDLDLPVGAVVKRVMLDVPVRADAGTASPEAATIAACRTTGVIEDGGGGEPPAADCEGAPTSAFDARFTFDVTALATSTSVAIALVPAGADTWHVAIDDREGEQPPTVVVTFESELAAPATSTPTTAALAPLPPLNRAPVALPTLQPPPVASGAAIAEQASVPPVATVTPSVTATGGFRYAAVFALPLVLLLLVGVLGDGLVRPVRLSPRGDG